MADSAKSTWRPMSEAPVDGSPFLARYWDRYDIPNGPYANYVVACWDALENDGWRTYDMDEEITISLADFIPIPEHGHGENQ